MSMGPTKLLWRNNYYDTFNPASFGDLGLWLKADAGITLVDGAVETWADQSGNGRDFTTITGTRPTYTQTTKGRPVVSFDGTQGMAGNAASLTLARQVPGLTIVSVFLHGSGSSRVISIGTNGATVERAILGTTSSNIRTGVRTLDANSAQNVDGGSRTPGSVCLAVARLDYPNASADITFNKQQIAPVVFQTPNATTSNTSSVNVRVGISVSGTNPINGYIAEILVYQKVLTDSQIDTLENYLYDKWGL